LYISIIGSLIYISTPNMTILHNEGLSLIYRYAT